MLAAAAFSQPSSCTRATAAAAPGSGPPCAWTRGRPARQGLPASSSCDLACSNPVRREVGDFATLVARGTCAYPTLPTHPYNPYPTPTQPYRTPGPSGAVSLARSEDTSRHHLPSGHAPFDSPSASLAKCLSDTRNCGSLRRSGHVVRRRAEEVVGACRMVHVASQAANRPGRGLSQAAERAPNHLMRLTGARSKRRAASGSHGAR